tara:strand:- start:514 stop:876 length:363 start_codon:yes stop_codon:yes gene_type:complete
METQLTNLILDGQHGLAASQWKETGSDVKVRDAVIVLCLRAERPILLKMRDLKSLRETYFYNHLNGGDVAFAKYSELMDDLSNQLKPLLEEHVLLQANINAFLDATCDQINPDDLEDIPF